MTKYVYSFEEGNKDMKELLGGKGANLAEMISIGLPVPSGFTVTTECCNLYYKNGEVLDKTIEDEIYAKLEELENKTGKKFGSIDNPLLLSVRSGARASMPGMMDTILNLGLNDEIASNYSKKINNPRFIYDSYRRLIQMFADVVKGYPKSSFERVLDDIKISKNIKSDIELNEQDLYDITLKFKNIYKELSGEDFPQNPKVQLLEAIKAVFRSWKNERAIIYRQMNNIPDSWGTAVNVQKMVYGNLGENSGTGVAFTRNPATGENKLYGEYLINAQGEDVVAGIRTPESIETLKNIMPDIYNEFCENARKLELHYKDMQDMEFTIENGKLYMLQTRNGKRTAQAALKIALDLYKEGLITKEEAVMRVEPSQLDQLLHEAFDETDLAGATVMTTGLAASPGAATGQIYFNAEDVAKAKEKNIKSILVRLETSPEDIQGMKDAEGILTVRGGMTSHAAVVARGMGRCCISGCSDVQINEEQKTLIMPNGKVYHEGDFISLDGTTGKVYDGKIKTVAPEISGDFSEFMELVDSIKVLGVRANADTPKDVKQAINFGAEGIGLCRTEHMFFEKDRILAIRKMIVAETDEQRQKALYELLQYQQSDFEEMFKAADGRVVTVRYLDPPLHEFLPHTDDEIKELASCLNMSFESLKARVDSLKEFNPMMGHRGCRLDITYPEIAIMQTTAVICAAINVQDLGIKVKPEIMIPLVGDINETNYVKGIILDTIDKLFEEHNDRVDYEIGVMIETPRACLIADELAEVSSFFSFGTNDLTQLTYGFSRDDAGKFLTDYYQKDIFTKDPFASLDTHGVGKLVYAAVTKAKRVRPNIELGICGEHAGEEKSIEFCHKVGLTYVSCSPFRVPAARLSAARAKAKEVLNILTKN